MYVFSNKTRTGGRDRGRSFVMGGFLCSRTEQPSDQYFLNTKVIKELLH